MDMLLCDLGYPLFPPPEDFKPEAVKKASGGGKGMNNAHYLYADSTGTKYGVPGNLWFYLKETWRYNPLLLAAMVLGPAPSLLAGYLGTLLPSLLVRGLSAQMALGALLGTVLFAGAGFLACKMLGAMLAAYRMEAGKFYAHHVTERFLGKMKDVDYELLESADYSEIYSNAWSCANEGMGFYSGVEVIPKFLEGLFGVVVFGWILGSRSLLILFLVFLCIGVDLYLLSVARKVHRKYYGKISQYARGEAYITNAAMDAAAGKDIRIYRMLDFLLKKYDENLGEIGARYGKIHNWYLFRNLSGAVLGFARDLAAYLFLIYELVQGRISAADFVFLLGVIDSLAVYFERFLRIMMVWNMLDAPVGYFRQFLETGSRYRTDAVVSEEKIAQMKREGIEIELDDVSYTYEGAKKPTISHFHLKIRQGERLALIGLNGAGKTTLVKLICGLYTPDEGRIRVNGIDREQFTREQYAGLFSVMFQDAYFLPLTLDENLTSSGQADRKRLESALKQSGFYEKYESLPKKGAEKLVKKLEETAVDFSGGEKQKLVFARAIYRDSAFVILDEPTAALDPIAENELYCNFGDAVGARTVLYISHRLSSTRFCDRILLLEDGAVIEEGGHEELLARGGRYAALYEMQSRYYKEEGGEQGGAFV